MLNTSVGNVRQDTNTHAECAHKSYIDVNGVRMRVIERERERF